MSDQFSLTGSYVTSPQVGSPSAIAGLAAPIDEELVLTAKYYDTITLSGDSPVTVNFGGVTNGHVVILKATGAKVRARITSADGSQQAVPFDSFFSNICRTVPITAIDLTRTAGILTTVDVFLGQITP